MGRSAWAKIIGLVLVSALISSACSSASSGANNATETTAVAALSVEDRCQQGAERIVERLETFTDGFGDVSPEDFLGQGEIEGLAAFQDDVAQVITSTANQSSTLCNLDGLQVFIDTELAMIEDPSLLTSYLVSLIRHGGIREKADVAVGPDDDIVAILELLDNGSTVTIKPGEYVFETALLFQHDIVIVGAGVEETTISSSSSDAAMAVFGQGKLTLRDLTVEHVGDVEASVILGFGAAIDIERVRVRGGKSADATSGGNGVLLSTGSVTEDGVTEEPAPGALPVPESRIVDSEISGNDVAGITIIGMLEPFIGSNRIVDNALCGLCYLGSAAGIAEQNIVRGNEFGIQVGDDASPSIRANTVRENVVAGMVILGRSTPQVSTNTIADNTEVGIAIQGEAAPMLANNVVSGQTFGFTIGGIAKPQIVDNTIEEAEVGLQVAANAAPQMSGTSITGVTGIGIVFRDDATGSFVSSTITGEHPVGVLVEGRAAPVIDDVSVTGSDVSVSYREQAAGTLSASTFLAPSIAVQVEDEAAPLISKNTIERPEVAGLVIRSTGVVEIRDNNIVDPTTLGIGLAGASQATVVSNTVTGGETAISFVEEAAGEIIDNLMSGQVVAIQVGDSAAPMIANNRITDAQGAALVFRDEASGKAVENVIVNPASVGIQVVDSAAPELRLNTVLSGFVDPEGAATESAESGAGNDSDGSAPGPDVVGESTSTVGILFAGMASGEAAKNQVLGFVIGIQISESATPKLIENDIDGGTELGVGMLFRDDAGGEATTNRTTNHSIGVQISDQASPVVRNNVVEQATEVAFLVQGTAQPTIEGNVCPAGVPGIGLLEQSSPVLGENVCQVITG